jgi:hypothetical protein
MEKGHHSSDQRVIIIIIIPTTLGGVGHMTVERKVANLVPDFSVCTLLAAVGFVGIWEEFRGRKKAGNESHERHIDDIKPSSSPNVLVQSAKSGCIRTINILYHFFYNKGHYCCQDQCSSWCYKRAK